MGGVHLNTNVSNNGQLNSPDLKGKSPDKGTDKTGSCENKKGTLAELKKNFSNFKAMIRAGISKQAVEKNLSSGPMSKVQTETAIKNIRSQSTSNSLKKNAERTSSDVNQAGKLREDREQKKLSLSKDPLLVNPEKLKSEIIKKRDLIVKSLNTSELIHFPKIDIARFSTTLDKLFELAPGKPSREGLMVMENFMLLLDSLPSDVKMQLADMLNAAKTAMVKSESQTLTSVPKKIISAPNLPSFQKNAVLISTPIVESLSQEANNLKGLSVEDDQALDAMLGKLNMEDSPELNDLEKLSQEIEKEFGSSIQEQNQQSNADRSAKLGRPATRPGPHQSTESKKEITQFFKEHNKMTKALDSAGQSENTVGIKSSNITSPVTGTGPTKNTIPSDSDYQELDDLSNELAAMVNKQGTEKYDAVDIDDEIDKALNDLEKMSEERKPEST